MNFLMGLRGRDFTMLCCDTTAVNQIITIKHDEDKIIPIDSHRMMGVVGESGDRVQFSEFIGANVRLYAMRNETPLSTKAIANYTRNELATALRKVRQLVARSSNLSKVHRILLLPPGFHPFLISSPLSFATGPLQL